MRRPSAASSTGAGSPRTSAAGLVLRPDPFGPVSKSVSTMPPSPSRAAIQFSSAESPSAVTAPIPVTTMRSAMAGSGRLGVDQSVDLAEHRAQRVGAVERVLGDLDAVLLFDGEDDADEVDGIETDVFQLGGGIELGPVHQRLLGDNVDQFFVSRRHRMLRNGGLGQARPTS